MREAVKFEIGQIVYSKINFDLIGQVTAIIFRSSSVNYGVTWSNDLSEKWHAEIEISSEKSFSNDLKNEGAK